MTTHSSWKVQASIHPAGFETAITAIERPQTQTLARAVTRFDTCSFLPSAITDVTMLNFFFTSQHDDGNISVETCSLFCVMNKN